MKSDRVIQQLFFKYLLAYEIRVVSHNQIQIGVVLNIGNVRSKAIKRISKNIVLKFYDQLSVDFEQNKHIVGAVTNVKSKGFRNRIAGYVTTIMRQIKDNKIQTLEELV